MEQPPHHPYYQHHAPPPQAHPPYSGHHPVPHEARYRDKRVVSSGEGKKKSVRELLRISVGNFSMGATRLC